MSVQGTDSSISEQLLLLACSSEQTAAVKAIHSLLLINFKLAWQKRQKQILRATPWVAAVKTSHVQTSIYLAYNLWR